MEGGRFCFEGGTRCGKGEGLHVLRADNPEDLQISFDLAAKARLIKAAPAVACICQCCICLTTQSIKNKTNTITHHYRQQQGFPLFRID